MEMEKEWLPDGGAMPDKINTFFQLLTAELHELILHLRWTPQRRRSGRKEGTTAVEEEQRTRADQSDSHSKERSLIGMLNKLRSTRSTQTYQQQRPAPKRTQKSAENSGFHIKTEEKYLLYI